MQKLIKELTALEAQATPGKWKIWEYCSDVFIEPVKKRRELQHSIAILRGPDEYESSPDYSSKEQTANANLIVAMRNALPELLIDYNYRHEHYEKLSDRIALQAQEKEILVHDLECYRKTTDDLQKQLDTAIARAEKTEAHLKHEEEYTTRLVTELEQVKIELKQSKDGLEHCSNKLTNEWKDHSATILDLHEVKKKRTRTHERVKSLEDSFANVGKQVMTLRAELDHKDEQVEALHETICTIGKELKDKLYHKDEEIKALEECYKAARSNSLHRLKDALETLAEIRNK